MRALFLSSVVASAAFAQGAPDGSAAAPSGQQSVVIVGVVASLNDEVAKKQADALASFVGIAVKEQTISRVFPDQEALEGMMREAGLEDCRHHNLSGGIVALHKGFRY